MLCARCRSPRTRSCTRDTTSECGWLYAQNPVLYCYDTPNPNLTLTPLFVVAYIYCISRHGDVAEMPMYVVGCFVGYSSSRRFSAPWAIKTVQALLLSRLTKKLDPQQCLHRFDGAHKGGKSILLLVLKNSLSLCQNFWGRLVI